MKKLNYKRILIAVLWITAIGGLAASLGFVSASEKNMQVKNLSIRILNNSENLFLTENGIREFLDAGNEKIVGANFNNISIPRLEKVLNTLPAVENAEVSSDMNGEVKMELTQRTPLLRVINKDGESYYLDINGKVMPLSGNFSARVIVANGEIFEPYARRLTLPVEAIRKSEMLSELSVLDDLMDVAMFIHNDAELNNLIHQVYVNADHELELFPAIGNHRILFGPAKDIAEKFNKLKLFYTQGLNKSGTWNKYTVINLKYKNQVVCTKK